METKVNCEKDNKQVYRSQNKVSDYFKSINDNTCRSSEDGSTIDDTCEHSAEALKIQTFFERYIISDEVFAHGGQAFISKGFDLQR